MRTVSAQPGTPQCGKVLVGRYATGVRACACDASVRPTLRHALRDRSRFEQGDRAAFIDRAKALLPDGVRLEAEAPLYENPAVGGPLGQGDFLNGAWIVATTLGPHQLLLALMGIEHALGRTRSVANGPRTIDLDILLAEDGTRVDTAMLQIPHPELHRRDFVLHPLRVIAGAWIHPVLGCRVDAIDEDFAI